MTRRLRISHVIVQPVLVWDDGEELSPGPTVTPISAPLFALPEMPTRLAAEVAAMPVDA